MFLIFLFYILKNKNIEFLYNGNYWNNYRLGDIIKGWIYRNQKGYYNNVSKRYPNSIADLYIKKTKNFKDKERHNNYKCLNEIIEKKIKDNKINKLPTKDNIVMHIRVGDSIKKFKNNKFHFIRNNSFGFTLDAYKNMLDTLYPNKKENKNKIIYLVYGAHINTNVKLSKLYIKKIKELLKSYNFKIEDYKSDPDTSYIFMVNSKIYIKGAGGFSSCISKHIKLKGGKVINPSDYKNK